MRILFFVVVGCLLLLGIGYGLLRTPYVQTVLVKYVTGQIERTTGVKIQVGGVDFRPMKSLVLDDVLLRDFREDTLLYCGHLRMKIDSFNLVSKSFTVKELLFDRACFNLYVMRGADGALMNIEMFIDSLRGRQHKPKPEMSGNPESGWLVGLDKVSLRRSRFTYREDEYEPVDYGVNWTDIDCLDLNVDVSDFDFADDYTAMRVSGLNLREKSGLVIRRLDGKMYARAGNLLVTESKIQLERSDLDLVKLEYNWTPDRRDWRYFITRMQQYYELGPSSVSFVDLAYFNGILRGIDNTVKCSGIVYNTIDSLRGRDLYFELGERSVFQGNFRSAGLPDVRHTLFNINIQEVHLNPEDLESVYLPWFDMNIPIPDPLHKLQNIDLERIKFDGTLDNFQVNAVSTTPALAGTLNFRYEPCGSDSADCSRMSGDFDLNRVDWNKFTGLSAVGAGDIKGIYNGILDDSGPAFNVKGKIGTLGVGKGQVRDADLFLTWKGEELNVMSSFAGDCAGGGVVMSYDNRDSLDFISARGHLELDDLEYFGFSMLGKHESARVGFNLVSAGQGKVRFSNLTLSDFRYTGPGGSFDIDRIGIESTINGDYTSATVRSGVADLSIDGNCQTIRPLEFAGNLLCSYLPAYAGKEKQKFRKTDWPKVDFQCVAEVKDLNRVLKVVCPGLEVAQGSRVVSRFRYGDELLSLSLNADTLSYRDFRLTGSKIEMSGNPERLRILYTGDKAEYAGQYRIYNVRNELDVYENHLADRLTWSNWGRHTFSGELAGVMTFLPDEKNGFRTEVEIAPGVVVLSDSVWRVRESAVSVNGREVEFRDFSIAKNNQFLKVKGRISEDPEEQLSVDLNGVSLSELGRVMFSNRFALFGTASGNLTVQDYYKDRLLSSDFHINDWGVNRDTLGTMRLRSFWDADSRSVIIGAENRIGNTTPLSVAGYYNPVSDSVNVTLRLAQVSLDRLGAYASDFLSETSGGVSGNLNIVGTASHPDVSGVLQLDTVRLKVNALNAHYSLNDKVNIVDNRLMFDGLTVKDQQGRTAVLKGMYDFWKNRYDLNVRLADFLVLDTDVSQNEAFYGKVYLDGMVELNNHDGQTNVTVNARTGANSKLYIPLTSGSAEQSNNFLHFISSAQGDRRRDRIVYDEGGKINLNANLEINDHLDIQVIFDPTVGDILRTSGEGNIKIAFDKEGSLAMFGNYRISSGNYLFTLSNLVNKKFVLTPGGTITWNGSPYEAMLNVGAVYNLKTSIYELLADGLENIDKGERNRKVPVECSLLLSERLMNPNVKFDINFPTLETQSRSYIQGLFSSQDEVNKQMFSLLLMNKFYQSNNENNQTNWGDQASSAGVTTVTEMVFSQFSRLLSQFSNNVDIGVAYHMGSDEYTNDAIEVEVATQFFNDRVRLSANGNMDVGGSKSTTVVDKNNTSNIAGDFDVEVKLNRPGTLKLKAYSHTDEKILYNREMIQGVGVSYQESFDTVRELVRRYFSFLSRSSRR